MRVGQTASVDRRLSAAGNGWRKLKPLEAAHRGCLNCPSKPVTLRMGTPLAVGFGCVSVTKDDECIWAGAPDKGSHPVVLTRDDAERLSSIASEIERWFGHPDTRRDIDYLRQLSTRIISSTAEAEASDGR